MNNKNQYRYHLNSSGDSTTPTSSISSNESNGSNENYPINNWFNLNYLKNMQKQKNNNNNSNNNNKSINMIQEDASMYQKRSQLLAENQQYLLQQEKLKLEHQLREMSPYQYQQYKQYQLQQKQRLDEFQKQLSVKEKFYQQLIQKRKEYQEQQNIIHQKLLNKKNNLKTINSNYVKNNEGIKSHNSGMTTEQTSDLSLPIHKSSFNQKQQQRPSLLPSFNNNHNKSQFFDYTKKQQISPKQYKKPLTSPNNITTKNNYYNEILSYNNSNDNNDQVSKNNDDELTDEILKRNVQIVLRNLDHYALQNALLSEQINSFSSSFNSNNNINNNNINIMTSLSSPVEQQHPDYNSNPFSYVTNLLNLNGTGNGHLNCSMASSNHDFTHDNSDYQWFLDYGYRDNGHQHQSILSSLSASYNGIGELSYYEDLAKNIDANLAEVDMESFRTEDIHSLLTHLPSFCKAKNHKTNDIDNSICKSELLFSPVKESPQQLISTDSLDLDAYPDDGDIILTCKANKDNYTIAFEGSTLYSDESFYVEPNDININIRNRHNFINLHRNLDDIVKRKSLEVSMCRSDNAFTTWSKLKKNNTLQRYPSGNNNTSVNMITRQHSPNCIIRKSSSLPNLLLQKEIEIQRQLNVSQALSTSTVDSSKLHNLPMCQMPISQTESIDYNNHESTESSNKMHTTESSESQQHMTTKQQQQQQLSANQPPAFNLVKLFIKQKSCSSSAETCMDVSSGCWPSSDGSSSSTERCKKKSLIADNSNTHTRRNFENEEHDVVNDNITTNMINETADSSYQLDSLDICDESQCTTKDSLNTTPTKKQSIQKHDLYREVFESSPKKLRNPLIYNLQVNNNNNNNNNNNSISDTTSENLTQIYNCKNNSKLKSLQSSVMTRSIQTSVLLKDRLHFIPPSFLATLNKMSLNSTIEKQSPVYVIYPNYALPDLAFVQQNPTSEIVLSPFNYKTALASAAISKKRRPTSLNTSDEEAIKHIDRNKISDWKSLVTLLPIEYRKRLKHIPEADPELDPDCSMKPLFCMSPPLRRNKGSRICDCAAAIQQYPHTYDSSSGSSSQQPSSGYRGSSTLLTDSEFDPPTLTSTTPDPLRNMFIYQYENIGSGELLQEKLPPSGRRGILRRNRSSSRNKRNSMFEENQNCNTLNFEKRRSLQEPQFYNESLEEYLEEEEVKQYYNNNIAKPDIDGRKSRRDKDAQDARIRAENFLSNIPKSELKYYAEIASILESSETNSVQYDAVKLKDEVSRALSQKRVSFNQNSENYLNVGDKKFTTPPNSPAISMAGLKINATVTKHRKELTQAEKDHQNKISSNRFKRLQIQWELLSKDSSMMLKDLASEKETKSGGSTPTSTQKSKIPRPVSYPATKTNVNDTKALRSPSRIIPPKRYSGANNTTTNTTQNLITTPRSGILSNNRISTNTSNGTPKKRAAPRTR